jgi:hypothetical protein
VTGVILTTLSSRKTLEKAHCQNWQGLFFEDFDPQFAFAHGFSDHRSIKKYLTDALLSEKVKSMKRYMLTVGKFLNFIYLSHDILFGKVIQLE